MKYAEVINASCGANSAETDYNYISLIACLIVCHAYGYTLSYMLQLVQSSLHCKTQ